MAISVCGQPAAFDTAAACSNGAMLELILLTAALAGVVLLARSAERGLLGRLSRKVDALLESDPLWLRFAAVATGAAGACVAGLFYVGAHAERARDPGGTTALPANHTVPAEASKHGCPEHG